MNKKAYFSKILSNPSSRLRKAIPVSEDKEFENLLERISDKYFDEFVATLPPRQQIYINHFFNEDLTYEEIAERENVGEATIRQAFIHIEEYKAYPFLYKCLEEECYLHGKDYLFSSDSINGFMSRANSSALERRQLDSGNAQLENISVKALNLSRQTLANLYKAEITLVSQLVSFTEEDLLSKKYIGAKKLEEIKTVLNKYGLELKSEQKYNLTEVFLYLINEDNNQVTKHKIPVVNVFKNTFIYELKDELGLTTQYHVKIENIGKVLQNNTLAKLQHVFLTEDNIAKAENIFKDYRKKEN